MSNENGASGNGIVLHKLTHAKIIQLWDWLRANRTRLMSERPRLDIAAQQATKDLGSLITEDNLKRVRKFSGVEWGAPTTRETGRNKSNGNSFGALRCASLARTVLALAKNHRDLCDSLGVDTKAAEGVVAALEKALANTV